MDGLAILNIASSVIQGLNGMTATGFGETSTMSLLSGG